jgi:acetyl-CoA carboxylase biotin carboxyl carrier protein
VDEAKLRKLIAIFQESGVEELEYQESFWRGVRVRLGRTRQAVTLTAPAQIDPQVSREAPSSTPGPTMQPDDAQGTVAGSEDGHTITSPMVGTFYRSPSPDSEPFASTGDTVTVGQTLCIIEAMKIMNEIEADASGEIAEILVQDGDPVEYNQPLIRLRAQK